MRLEACRSVSMVGSMTTGRQCGLATMLGAVGFELAAMQQLDFDQQIGSDVHTTNRPIRAWWVGMTLRCIWCGPPQNLKIKQQIFADLERACRKDAILSTNTSTINIELVGAKTQVRVQGPALGFGCGHAMHHLLLPLSVQACALVVPGFGRRVPTRHAGARCSKQYVAGWGTDGSAACLQAADRIIGAHFFSPAHLMPLLEIVRSDKTSPQVRSVCPTPVTCFNDGVIGLASTVQVHACTAAACRHAPAEDVLGSNAIAIGTGCQVGTGCPITRFQSTTARYCRWCWTS
jgi:3-hydroxyacyl-CoA dehydrogenase, NAD binding domain